MVIITIDRKACVSCGSCYDACPGFFEQNPDDSFSQVVEKYRTGGKIETGKPPADAEKCAREAVDICPAQAIAAEEE